MNRCYNCGDLSHHVAAKCSQGPQPKRCHNCKAEDHLIADCPTKVEKIKNKVNNSANCLIMSKSFKNGLFRVVRWAMMHVYFYLSGMAYYDESSVAYTKFRYFFEMLDKTQHNLQ